MGDSVGGQCQEPELQPTPTFAQRGSLPPQEPHSGMLCTFSFFVPYVWLFVF